MFKTDDKLIQICLAVSYAILALYGIINYFNPEYIISQYSSLESNDTNRFFLGWYGMMNFGAVAGLIQGQGAVESGVRGAASAGAAALAAPLGPLASGAASFLADSVASLFFPSGDDPIGPKTKIGRETLGTPTAKEILTDYADA